MIQTPISMPGTLLPDHRSANRPRLIRAAGHSTFFAPPSPLSSRFSSHSITSTSRIPLATSNSSRKRPRVDTNHASNSNPQSPYCDSFSATSYISDLASPPPLANEQYQLAGGTDTPVNLQLRRDEKHEYDFEQDYRPNRYAHHRHPQTPHPSDSNDRKRRSSSSTRGGWGETVWAITGGVAGKVLNFCWNTAFRGFYAGPGPTYRVDVGTPNVASNTWTEIGEKDDVFHSLYQSRVVSPLPGGFPEDDLIEDYTSMQPSQRDEMTPTQSNDSNNRSVLKNSWVIVDQPIQNGESSPVRKRSKPSTASLYARPCSRNSQTRPRLQATRSSGSNASVASPRGLSYGSNPSRSGSFDGSTRQHVRSISSVSLSRPAETNDGHRTPKSPEVKKFEKKLRRKEELQDESIRRLNQQMQDMIKEAQQALGAKIEVCDDVDDEGYEDELGSASAPIYEARW